MANTAWSLLMKLQGDSSSLQRAVSSSESSLRGLGKTTQSVGRGMSASGKALTVAVTAPLLAAGGGAIKMASDYESAFAGVKKTLGSDWNQSEIEGLSDDIRKMAREDIPLAATELAAIGEAGGALGIAKNTMLEFISTTGLLSETTDLTSDAAATALGHLNTSLRLTQGEYVKTGDALVYLGNRGASTESQILSMAEGFAGTAGLFDLGIDQVLGWGAAVANTGEEAEAGASSLSRFFQNTFQMAQQGGDELELMAEIAGTTADKFKKSMEDDISGTLESLIVGMGELTQAEQLAALEALGFTDIRITRAILKLTANTDNLTTSLRDAETGFADSGAMAKEAAQRHETFAAQLQFLKNELTDIGIELGTMLLPIIREDVIPIIRDALDAVREWVDWFKALEPEERKQVVMWAAIAAAMGPALFIAGKLLSAFGSILKVGGSIAGMFGGLGRLGPGGGQGALSRVMAQPVFVTNWPPGMGMGGGNPLSPTSAAGRGFLASVKSGLMFGMKWIAGPLAAVFAGWEIGQMLNEQVVAPARDYETGQVDAVLASGDSDRIARAIKTIEEQLNTDDWAAKIALALDVNGVRSTLEAQLAALRDAQAEQESTKRAVEDAASHDQVLLQNHGGKLDKLATAEVIEHLRRTNEMGLAGVGTSFQVGLTNGLDPLGDTATRILARAEDPKAPAVMNEIQGHIAGLEEIQAQYLAQGDIPLANKVQANIDTLNRLIGKEDQHRAATEAAAAAAASSDAAMLTTAREQKIAAQGGRDAIHALNASEGTRFAGLKGSIDSMHGTLARKNFNPIIYMPRGDSVGVTGSNIGMFHSGTWNTGPSGGLAMLHDEEMVLPKREAKAFRRGDFIDALGGGGRQGDLVLKAEVQGLIKAETARDLVRPMRALARTGHMQRRGTYRYE